MIVTICPNRPIAGERLMIRSVGGTSVPVNMSVAAGPASGAAGGGATVAGWPLPLGALLPGGGLPSDGIW